jgi:ferredoxin
MVEEGSRLACQLCDRPAPDYRAADVLVGLVGVDTDEKILILADEATDARLGLDRLTDRPATERETVDREVTVWRLSERKREAAQRKLEALGLADAYPGVIMGYMQKCTLCGDCLDACPQWSDELRGALSKGREAFVAALVNESVRLASCSGCGMCQAHCPEGVPISAIIRSLSLQIQRRMHYAAGRDVKEPLPWVS